MNEYIDLERFKAASIADVDCDNPFAEQVVRAFMSLPRSYPHRKEVLRKFSGRGASDPEQILRTLRSTYSSSCHGSRQAS